LPEKSCNGFFYLGVVSPSRIVYGSSVLNN
jgi:hypothetical protein